MLCPEVGGGFFCELSIGGDIMKHVVLALGMMVFLVFAACGQEEKAETPAMTQSEKATDVTGAMKEEGSAAMEAAKEKTHEVAGAMAEKTEGAVEAVGEKAEEAGEALHEKAESATEAVGEHLQTHPNE
jgi:hypothetical protein